MSQSQPPQRAFHVEIPIIFLLPVEAETIEDAQRLAGRMTIDDAIERHTWYCIGRDWGAVEGALPDPPEPPDPDDDDQDEDAAEGGESN